MTLTSISVLQLPSSSIFLNTVCPVITSLDDNVHFELENSVKSSPNESPSTSDPNLIHTNLNNINSNTDNDDDTIQNPKYINALQKVRQLDWPFLGTNSIHPVKANLELTYLNIARPPLNNFNGQNESTTYISLPFHITELFTKIVNEKERAKQLDGGMHIGANVNPLIHDPFKLVHLTPSCITSMINLEAFHSVHDNKEHDLEYFNLNSSKNPFNKMTTSFNKLLKITTTNSNDHIKNSNFQSLPSIFNLDNKTTSAFNILGNNSNGASTNNNNNNEINHIYNEVFDKLLDFDHDTYFDQILNISTSKLLVSAHVNVLNIIAINSNANYMNTKQLQSDKFILPTHDDTNNVNNDSSKSASPIPSEYTKVIESPILRLKLNDTLIITQLKTFTNSKHEPVVLMGLDSGALVFINLIDLHIRIFDDFDLNHYRPNSSNDYNVSVTSIEIISNQKYDMIIVAGYANGEVVFIDPYDESTPNQNEAKYIKRVVGKDDFITYFKKFDLSPTSCGNLTDSLTTTSSNTGFESPDYLIGHMKLSHKAITSISSTMPYNPSFDKSGTSQAKNSLTNPMIIAFASDDGLVRLIDLINTHDKNYGDLNNSMNNSLVTDIISNYFNDGINDTEFSPDYKFLCIVGKGDLIEIFKMSYYNVNGLLIKNSHNHGNNSNINLSSNSNKRSRSGTINSSSSANGTITTLGNNGSSYNHFLSPVTTNPSTNFDSNSFNNNNTNETHNHTSYPPIIKDIKIIGRLKGHTNTVKSIEFIKLDEFDQHDNENSSSPIYKLISCGYDGKIIGWEFDYKALPKVKKQTNKSISHNNSKNKRSLHHQPSSIGSPPIGSPQMASPPIGSNNVSANARKPNNSTSTGMNLNGITNLLSSSPIKSSSNRHSRTRSWNLSNNDDPSSPFNSMNNGNSSSYNNNMNQFLDSIPMINEPSSNSQSSQLFSTQLNNSNNSNNSNITNTLNDQLKIINSLYKSLFDLRLKRHYNKLSSEQNKSPSLKKFNSIIHPIISDKLVPSIEIPLMSIDLSYFIKDGKIDGFHLGTKKFWIFAKNGDIFKFNIE